MSTPMLVSMSSSSASSSNSSSSTHVLNQVQPTLPFHLQYIPPTRVHGWQERVIGLQRFRDHLATSYWNLNRSVPDTLKSDLDFQATHGPDVFAHQSALAATLGNQGFQELAVLSDVGEEEMNLRGQVDRLLIESAGLERWRWHHERVISSRASTKRPRAAPYNISDRRRPIVPGAQAQQSQLRYPIQPVEMTRAITCPPLNPGHPISLDVDGNVAFNQAIFQGRWGAPDMVRARSLPISPPVMMTTVNGTIDPHALHFQAPVADFGIAPTVIDNDNLYSTAGHLGQFAASLPVTLPEQQMAGFSTLSATQPEFDWLLSGLDEVATLSVLDHSQTDQTTVVDPMFGLSSIPQTETPSTPFFALCTEETDVMTPHNSIYDGPIELPTDTVLLAEDQYVSEQHVSEPDLTIPETTSGGWTLEQWEEWNDLTLNLEFGAEAGAHSDGCQTPCDTLSNDEEATSA